MSTGCWSGARSIQGPSHRHLDHFWGIELTLKHNPRLKMYAPATWREEDRLLLREKGNIEVEDHEGRTVSICRNGVPHEGDLILTEAQGEDGSGIYRLLPGVALRMFDCSMLLQVRGENVLFVNVADKGIVTVTGCGHPGIYEPARFRQGSPPPHRASTAAMVACI